MSCTFTNETFSQEAMKTVPTRQLLKELRWTYRQSCPKSWACDGQCNQLWCTQKEAYQAKLKAELATREHIPNKIESKQIRKACIKRGV